MPDPVRCWGTQLTLGWILRSLIFVQAMSHWLQCKTCMSQAWGKTGLPILFDWKQYKVFLYSSQQELKHNYIVTLPINTNGIGRYSSLQCLDFRYRAQTSKSFLSEVLHFKGENLPLDLRCCNSHAERSLHEEG